LDQIIRRPTIKDIETLLSIDEQSFETDWFNEKQFRYYIDRAASIFAVADSMASIVGYSAGIEEQRANRKRARLYSIAVLPKYRRVGVGTSLLNYFIQEAKKRACESITLEVNQSNRKAIALYERSGFIPMKLLAEYYGPAQNAIRMYRPLSDQPVAHLF
jgi:ribosomal-protein-alanine N-acetyltransferase